MLSRDAGTQDSMPDLEPHRRRERCGLAVDAGVEVGVRIDLERRGHPLTPQMLEAFGTRPRRRICDDGDAEQPVFDAGSGARPDDVSETVLVVGHHDRGDGLVRCAVRVVPGDRRLIGVGTQHLRRDVEQGLGFRVAVALALNRLAVDAE